MPTEKTRTVKFYRIEPLNANTPGWPQDDNIVGKIRNKLNTSPADPYIRLTYDMFIVERHASRPNLHVSVSTVRHDNLPNLEENGRTDPLPLEDDQNLAEPTHLVFFEDNVVGLARGLATPGHLKTSAVLSQRIGVDVILTPILRPEVEALVMNSVAVTKLKLKVAGTSFNGQAANSGDPVEATHRLINQFSGAGWANIEMTATGSADRQRFTDWVRRHMEHLTPNRGVQSAKATVITQAGESSVIDLLEDELAQTVTWTSASQTRHPDPAEIRGAIEGCFSDNRSVIFRALEIKASGGG